MLRLFRSNLSPAIYRGRRAARSRRAFISKIRGAERGSLMPSMLGRSNLDLKLATAVIGSSHAPVLLLDEDRVVVGASQAFCHVFGIEEPTIVGRAFESLGDGEWAVPQLQSLLKATAAGFAEVRNYEFLLKRKGRTPRCLIVN